MRRVFIPGESQLRRIALPRSLFMSLTVLESPGIPHERVFPVTRKILIERTIGIRM